MISSRLAVCGIGIRENLLSEIVISKSGLQGFHCSDEVRTCGHHDPILTEHCGNCQTTYGRTQAGFPTAGNCFIENSANQAVTTSRFGLLFFFRGPVGFRCSKCEHPSKRSCLASCCRGRIIWMGNAWKDRFLGTTFHLRSSSSQRGSLLTLPASRGWSPRLGI